MVLTFYNDASQLTGLFQVFMLVKGFNAAQIKK